MKSVLKIVLVLVCALPARAVNSLEQEFTCPIDGTQWRQRVESSSSPNGLRLDLRQLGDVVDPPTLPQCPKCRFPLFSDQLAPAVIERLKPFVLGADFQILASKYPAYFCLAQVQEFLRAPHRYVALSYLRASWQVEAHEASCRRMLERAHVQFAGALSEMKPDDRHLMETAMLCGEVERRLGQWEQAEKRFRQLAQDPSLADARLKLIVARQLMLIKLRDPEPRALDAAAGKADGTETTPAAPGAAPQAPSAGVPRP